MGVPKNTLITAKCINQTSEIFSPKMRAIAFYAAAAHDVIQLCGRTAHMGYEEGDELLSAVYAKDTSSIAVTIRLPGLFMPVY